MNTVVGLFFLACNPMIYCGEIYTVVHCPLVLLSWVLYED